MRDLPDPRADAPPVAGATWGRMSEDDLDEVVAIEAATFATPWRREHFEFELRDNPHALVHVVRGVPRVLAYAAVWHLDTELKINTFAVHPEHRGRGLGRWLLGRVLHEARESGCRLALLEVRPSNVVARRLYASFGFVEVGRRRDFYRHGEDALVLEAALEAG